jgi:hypothetical protein
MVYNTQNYWGFGLFTSSGILGNTTFRKLDLFPSSGEGGGEDTYSVGPLERANLNHWILTWRPRCHVTIYKNLHIRTLHNFRKIFSAHYFKIPNEMQMLSFPSQKFDRASLILVLWNWKAGKYGFQWKPFVMIFMKMSKTGSRIKKVAVYYRINCISVNTCLWDTGSWKL